LSVHACLRRNHNLGTSKNKADKVLEPSDYKHVALGLIFLKHISNAFEAKQAVLLAEDPEAAEDPDEYLAENIF
jgi:type I restriction enzyme M protein